MVIRIPIIPSLSDTDDFKLLLNFIEHNINDAQVELMPYHRLGRNKYDDLGMNYNLWELPPCEEEDLLPYKKIMGEYSITMV